MLLLQLLLILYAFSKLICNDLYIGGRFIRTTSDEKRGEQRMHDKEPEDAIQAGVFLI